MPTLTIDATGEPITEDDHGLGSCHDCASDLNPDEVGANVIDGNELCESCRDEYYSCSDCSDMIHGDDTHTVNGDEIVCDSCADNYYCCEDCDIRVSGDYICTVGYDRYVCDTCRDNSYDYCEGCGEYYNINDGRCCNDDCDCEAPAQSFAFPNATTGDAISNDARVPMTLAEGLISEVGIHQIIEVIRNSVEWPSYRDQYIRDENGNAVLNEAGNGYVMSEAYENAQRYARVAYGFEEAVGVEWARSDGNFTKRLSRYAYQSEKIKLEADVVSKIGNIARDNSKGIDVEFELTRNLNMSASDFFHDSSCWWSDYAESRCALKSNGGMGLRTFKTESYPAYEYQIGPWAHDFGRAYTPVGKREHEIVSGRAWVMPLLRRDNRWVPTFDANNADGYIVFNGYGDLEGYAPARIVAALTGMKYVKVDFSCDPMYVNAGGYLVTTDEHLSTASFDLGVNTHADLYNREQMMTNA